MFEDIRRRQAARNTNRSEIVKHAVHDSMGKLKFEFVAGAADAEYRDCSCRPAARKAESRTSEKQLCRQAEHTDA
jgi:hypothetical protein